MIPSKTGRDRKESSLSNGLIRMLPRPNTPFHAASRQLIFLTRIVFQGAVGAMDPRDAPDLVALT